MADEVLKRWDEAAQQWKVVASVTRLEVQAGGGGMACWELMTSPAIPSLFLTLESGFLLTDISTPD